MSPTIPRITSLAVILVVTVAGVVPASAVDAATRRTAATPAAAAVRINEIESAGAIPATGSS